VGPDNKIQANAGRLCLRAPGRFVLLGGRTAVLTEAGSGMA